MKRKKINIVTLGCSKNLVDSEHLGAQLDEAGYEIVTDSNDTSARTVVINTCGFIGDAKQESIDTILEFAAAKTDGRIDHLFVIGCLSERYADELRTEIPEVDDYFGARSLREVVEVLGAEYNQELETERLLTTPEHYAYLKIAEGCNWHCAYCAIPLIRGRHRSVPMEKLLEEAEGLAEAGVKELIVIAQDTTYYGMDLYGRRRLGELLRRLCRIEGIEWIRLHYAYPSGFPDDVIEAMRDEPKICKYLDLPLQHIADNQLSAMNRRIDKAETIALVERLRREIPDLALRTTMMVGFPTESESDFAELCDFVRTTRFERLGVFAYSPEEGTPSFELPDDVDEATKESRVERLMELQKEISLTLNSERVGRTMRVIIDSTEGDYRVARSQYDSPEVDEEILVSSAEELQIGGFYTVRITDCEEYDLYGEVEKQCCNDEKF
ncbi:MAG: 30S ribosomal protein S12 methylthiotransferase RimO [Tidjanibacter sp.]|nr:30S ribosomal protein S12 methylthiotransferase RimO [Tidjanibacter sp.]